jgi:hypothetical protein
MEGIFSALATVALVALVALGTVKGVEHLVEGAAGGGPATR